MHDPQVTSLWVKLQSLAKAIDDGFNGENCPPAQKTMGFTLIVYPMNDISADRVCYVQNSPQDRTNLVLQEYLAKRSHRAGRGSGKVH